MPAGDSDKVQVQKSAIIALLDELSTEELISIFESAMPNDAYREYIITTYQENYDE